MNMTKPADLQEGYFNFYPDVIAEVTSVCDRACPGCYAPNVVSIDINKFAGDPKLFLSPEDLSAALAKHGSIESLAIRGGEPSRHPLLPKLLETAALSATTIYLETHGRWILPEALSSAENKNREALLEICQRLQIIVKVSFDKMHGLSETELFLITSQLDFHSIPWIVAFTESNAASFSSTRASCSWIPNEKIILQKKATNLENLVRPRIGVVGVDGILKETLATRFTKHSRVR